MSATEASSVHLVATLGIAGLLSGLALVGAYELTLPTITENRRLALEQAVLEVLPGSDRMERVEEGLYAGYAGEERTGYAIAASGPGFQDTIALLYGYDPARERIVGMRILESRETPGLGDKIFKDAAFVGIFSDLSPDPEIVLVKNGARQAPNEVDAITGATISSRAVVKIINGAHASRREQLAEEAP